MIARGPRARLQPLRLRTCLLIATDDFRARTAKGLFACGWGLAGNMSASFCGQLLLVGLEVLQPDRLRSGCHVLPALVRHWGASGSESESRPRGCITSFQRAWFRPTRLFAGRSSVLRTLLGTGQLRFAAGSSSLGSSSCTLADFLSGPLGAGVRGGASGSESEPRRLRHQLPSQRCKHRQPLPTKGLPS